MKPTDVLVFGGRAWSIKEIENKQRVRLRMLAGPEESVGTSTTVDIAFLQGRPIYRMVSALEDIDVDLAKDEVTEKVDVSEFGSDPRRWTEEFSRLHGSRMTPDPTLMLGWFARAIEAGIESKRRPTRKKVELAPPPKKEVPKAKPRRAKQPKK